MPQPMDRRNFLRLAGAGLLVPAAGGLLGACGGDDNAASSAPTPATTKAGGGNRKVKIGFIALTDCASIVMADNLGYFKERGLEVTLEKQASWPATRDNLKSGQIDAAHCLFSMPMSVASGVSGSESFLKIAMVLNNNGQAITLNKDLAAAGYGDLAAAKSVLDGLKEPKLAMTYPGGTHDTWLRYWLKATKAEPSIFSSIIPIPPPQMVANMKAEAMVGFCVGEPWNAVAVAEGIGFTHLATQDLWNFHPEKALVVNDAFVARDDVLGDVMGAVLKASKWLDDIGNRLKAAQVLGEAAFVNAPAADIAPRLQGLYKLGAGLPDKTFEGNQMVFHRDGLVNFPRRSHAIWFLAQFERFGLLEDAPNHQKLADELILTDLYEKVASAEGIDVPDDDMAPFEVILDKTMFDPKNPNAEATRP